MLTNRSPFYQLLIATTVREVLVPTGSNRYYVAHKDMEENKTNISGKERACI